MPSPTMMSHAKCTAFVSAMVGSSSVGNALRPWTTVLVPVSRIGQEGGEAGYRDPAGDGAVRVLVTEEHLGHVVAGRRHELDGRELGGLVVVDPAGKRVAYDHLHRRRDRGDRERDDEAESVVASRCDRATSPTA